MKNTTLFIFVLLLSLLLIGCSSSAAAAKLPENFADTAKPMAENLITGLQAQDYAIFSRDFNEKMVTAIPAAAMNEVHKLLWNQYGEYQSLQTEKISEEKGYWIGLYEVEFEKGKFTMQVVFSPESPHKISGLWFPPN
jgi:hypothetical protein